MKINLKSRSSSAYALVIVLAMSACAMIILGGTLNRTYGVARLNSRAIDMMNAQNAAEAALEKVFAHMQYDFQSAGGLNMVSNNLSTYRTLYPGSQSGEDAYWGNFSFSDAQGHANKTYVSLIGTLNGQPLPIAYSNRIPSSLSPIYRLVSNAKPTKGTSGAVGTAQEDVVLALIPLTAYAIFYNGLLEFSTCATMTVNGAVHSNTNIYVGAGGSATLTFNTTVTASGTVTAPANNGSSWIGPTNYNATNWRTVFNGASNFIDGLATIQLSIPMTNTYSLISVPATNDSATILGQERLYNQAQVILTVSNQNTTDPYNSNIVVSVQIQKAPSAGTVPGGDTAPTILTYSGSNASPAALTTNLPFLSLTNIFYDRRESKTNVTTQIDIGKYAQWLTNASSPVVAKFPADGSAGYPTIIYVNENRNTTTAGGHKLDSVRVMNGIAPPRNGGAGFSVATPDPLYVWGNYNQTNSAYLGTTNTSSGTVPCAFMSDAITMLSSNWTDAHTLSGSFSGGGSWAAANDTVNAAILTGIVPSTGTTSTTFSGGVHNLPRLLEDWSGGVTLTLNTSIINLYNSQEATNVFQNPGIYYDPPTRKFSYDMNFMDPNKVPPGIPDALVALRYNWCTPPANTVTYNVTP